MVFDPENPDKQPRFRSWLTKSFKAWYRSSKASRESREIKTQKKKEEGDEIRKAMVQRLKFGEERREVKRKRKEEDAMRMEEVGKRGG